MSEEEVKMAIFAKKRFDSTTTREAYQKDGVWYWKSGRLVELDEAHEYSIPITAQQEISLILRRKQFQKSYNERVIKRLKRIRKW